MHGARGISKHMEPLSEKIHYLGTPEVTIVGGCCHLKWALAIEESIQTCDLCLAGKLVDNFFSLQSDGHFFQIEFILSVLLARSTPRLCLLSSTSEQIC